jgi:hypothetical protein
VVCVARYSWRCSKTRHRLGTAWLPTRLTLATRYYDCNATSAAHCNALTTNACHSSAQARRVHIEQQVRESMREKELLRSIIAQHMATISAKDKCIAELDQQVTLQTQQLFEFFDRHTTDGVDAHQTEPATSCSITSNQLLEQQIEIISSQLIESKKLLDDRTRELEQLRYQQRVACQCSQIQPPSACSTPTEWPSDDDELSNAAWPITDECVDWM